MKIILGFIIFIHSLIHLMGFVKGYNLAEIPQLTQPISKLFGTLWLLTTIIFLLSLIFASIKSDFWWIFATIAIVFSQILIIQSWQDAKFGTIANIIILLPVIMGFMNSLPSSFQNTYKAEVQKRLNPITDKSLVTEKDLTNLPDPVKKYLHYVGAVGKPKVHNMKVISKGSMKRTPQSDWMDINSSQYNFFDEQTRLFYINSTMFGIPFDGLHAYIGNSAVMQIKVASLFQVVDAKGEKMNQSENVTLFNDMCLLAPATLIDKKIQWELIDDLTVKVKFTNNNNTISAILYFNKKGELIDFSSNDRYLSADGKTYLSYKWTTPVKGYKELNGRKVVTYGEAIWHMPEGEYPYAKFNMDEVEYNVQ